MVAPADSYVCFPAVGPCSEDPIPEQWADLQKSDLLRITGASSLLIPTIESSVSREEISPALLQRNQSLDVCPKILHAASTDKSVITQSPVQLDNPKACVIYKSPILTAQLIESMKRLNYAVRACERIQSAINRQREIFAVQEEVADQQVSAETLMSRANQKDMRLSEDEKEEYLTSKETVIAANDAVRSAVQEQMLQREFVEKLYDARFQVDLAMDAVNVEVKFLKLVGAQDCGEFSYSRPLVPNGAWVTKGTPVLLVR